MKLSVGMVKTQIRSPIFSVIIFQDESTDLTPIFTTQ